MKKFNLTKTIFAGALVALIAVGVQSCKKDETPDRDKFIGTWKYNESCDGALVVDYTTLISQTSTDEEKVSITGFAGFECGGSDITVEGTVSGSDITITPNQIFCAGQILVSSGNGTINDSENSITITYSYTVNGVPGSCTGTYTKI